MITLNPVRLRIALATVMAALLWPAAPAARSQDPPGQADRLLRDVEELIEKADPRRDDWRTEQLQAVAGEQLKRLAAVVERAAWDTAEAARFLAPDARCTPLQPASVNETPLAGGLRVARAAAPGPANWKPAVEALREWSAGLHCGGDPPHLHFKIIGVTADAPADWSCEVRCEAAAHCAGGPLQQTATWRIQWTPASEQEAALIRSIRLLSFEQTRAPQRLFTEGTTTVLSGTPGMQPELLYGADYWYGKIDAVGEINFMGHQGIAVGDVNGDGLEDVYVALGTGLPNKLLVRQPDGSVRDTAQEAGVAWLDDTKGVVLADMDNDGDQDLLCAMGPTIVLCRNDGVGRFDRQPFISMRAPTYASFYSIAVADYDLDGDLDIYGTRYVKLRYGVSVPVPFHDANNGPTNHLLRNDGDERFVDVTQQVGLNVNNARFSLAAAWADYDNDGDPDLYVANDFGRNNLYRNEAGMFFDVADVAGAEDQAAGMGASWSDYDNDGDLDLYVSNMFSSAGRRIAYQSRFQRQLSEAQRLQIQRHSLGNTLLTNQGDGSFRDTSDLAGVRMGRWAWGARFVDFNNDGFDDLVVPNGFLTNERADDL